MTAQCTRFVWALLLLGSSGAFVAGCRKDAPSSSNEASGANAELAQPETSEAAASDATGRAARAVESHADEARRDGGSIDPACEGASLWLLRATVDERCAVPEREWNALAQGERTDAGERGDGGRRAELRQEALREGDRVVVSIVNGGSTPIVVPLRFHPGHPELAFSVLAEDDKHAVFELAPPTPEAPREAPRVEDAGARARRRAALLGLDAGSDFLRVHSARIRLPPGGVARARIDVDPRIVKRLDRSCGDAGDCMPSRLPKGHVVLYVGQLVAGIDAGAPARVEWDAP